MARLVGLDLGTSGLKGIVVDETGRVLRSAAREYPLLTPRPGWTEQNPEAWWTAAQEVLAELDEPRPDAIGLAGQMHGSVFLDADGEVVRPALLWNDARTAAQCAEIDRRVGPERVRAITGNPPLVGFQAPKILWLREHEPSNFARVAKVLLPKDYLLFKLTEVCATEASDASGTGLLDLAERDWSAEMLAALDLPRSLFPDVYESSAWPFRTPEGVPVSGGGGDQAAGAVGTGAVAPGIVSVSLGTSGVVFTAIPGPEADPDGRAHTFCHANLGWHAMGVQLSCGGALRWFRDTFHPGRPYDEVMALAESAPAGAGGVTFLPYLAGERTPHNDPEARAALSGMSLATGPAEIARAVVEGVSFGLADGWDVLAGLGARADEVRVTGGGARSPFWRGMLADLFGAPVVTLAADEGPALGAALLAGVGVGIWPDVASACAASVRPAGTTAPAGGEYSEARTRFRAAYRGELAARDPR